MEIAIFTLLFLVGFILPVSVGVYRNFESGRIEINRLKNPTLYRLQRTIRARNPEARELELKASLAEIKSNNDRFLEEQVAPFYNGEYTKKVAKNRKELDAFQWELDAPERAKAELEAKKKAEEDKKAAEVARQLKEQELAEYTRKELERQKEAQRQWYLDEKKRRDENIAELARREAYYYSVNEDPDASYGDRYVKVHAVYVRRLPHTTSKVLANLTQGEKVTVDGWINSEVHWNIGIWFRVTANQDFPHGGWIWSGSLNTHSTAGLANLNEEPETVEVRSAGGDSWFYTQPTQMERMIESEKRHRKERPPVSYYQPTAPELGHFKYGDVWYDTDNRNKPHNWSDSEMTWVPVSNSLITANHITANMITGGSINTGSGMSITRDGITFDANSSLIANGGLTAPIETEYHLPMSTSNPYAPKDLAAERRKRDEEEAANRRRRQQQEEEDRRRRQRDQDFLMQQNNAAMNVAIFSAIF